ncbi:MAG: hypothetical protein U0R52_09055 [Solirubrobacterales bacterium]
MSAGRGPGAQAASAGMMLIVTMVGCGAIAYGLGSLFGAAVPLGLAGLFVGLFVGLGLVYSRFRRV